MSVSAQFVRNLALRAGELISAKYHAGTIDADEKCSYADLVTEADKAVEEFLKSQILKDFPTHKFIAEESYSGKVVLTDEPTWIIDPIDGTSNFVSKFPFVAVSIAFYEDKEAVHGVVYNPILQCLYCAKKGGGAYRNDQVIHVSNVTKLQQALVLTDWGGDRSPENLDKKIGNMREIIAQARGIRTMGSAALHICQIAAGSGDAFFEFGIHCWDYAAAMLIVREAGGYCCNYDGSPVDLMARNIVCAGTPELAKAVCSIIQPIHYVHD